MGKKKQQNKDKDTKDEDHQIYVANARRGRRRRFGPRFTGRIRPRGAFETPGHLPGFAGNQTADAEPFTGRSGNAGRGGRGTGKERKPGRTRRGRGGRRERGENHEEREKEEREGGVRRERGRERLYTFYPY